MTILNKYAKTIAIVATQALNEKPLGLISEFPLRLFHVVIMLSLWRTIMADRGVVSGMGLEAVLTYMLIASVFGSQLVARTQIDNDVWSGKIANRMLRPMGLYGQILAEMVGGWIPNLLLFSLPLLLAAPLLDMAFGFTWWLCYGVHLLSSCAVVIAFSYVWSALAFCSPVSAEEISSEVVAFTRQLKSFPLDGLYPLLTTALLSIVPVGFVAWYPCRVLLGVDGDAGVLWLTPLFACALSLRLQTSGEGAPVLERAELVQSEAGWHEYVFDAEQVKLTALLEAASAQAPVLDVETHRAPIDEVIADIYAEWEG